MSNIINIITWNARGIRNKKDELFNFLLNRNIHVCLISETLLNHSISIKHRDFYCYRNDRIQNRGGGVAVLIRKNIEHTLLPPLNTFHIENIGVKIRMSNGSFINIYSCYFPGGNAGRDNVKKQQFKSDLRKFYTNGGQFILGGDFNSRHNLWGCQRSNCWGNLLFEKLDSDNFRILYPSENTYIPSDSRRRASTLDFYLTNTENILTSPIAINDLGSDHLPVKITINNEISSVQRSFYDFKKANWPRFASFIKRNLEIDNNNHNTVEDVDSAIMTFNNTLSAAVNYSVPKKSAKLLNQLYHNTLFT